jgi:hypothetical protein
MTGGGRFRRGTRGAKILNARPFCLDSNFEYSKGTKTDVFYIEMIKNLGKRLQFIN